MSNPEPNSAETQAKRHIGPIVGISAALLVAGGLLFFLLGNELAVQPSAPEGADAQVDGRTGEVEDVTTDPTTDAPAPSVTEQAPPPAN